MMDRYFTPTFSAAAASSGVPEMNAPTMCCPKISITAAMIAEVTNATVIAHFIPVLIRSIFAAPRFCPT